MDANIRQLIIYASKANDGKFFKLPLYKFCQFCIQHQHLDVIGLMQYNLLVSYDVTNMLTLQIC